MGPRRRPDSPAFVRRRRLKGVHMARLPGFLTPGAVPWASPRRSLRHRGSTPATCSPLSTAPTPPWPPDCCPTATARRRGLWRGGVHLGRLAVLLPGQGALLDLVLRAVRGDLRGGPLLSQGWTFSRRVYI